MKNRGVTLVELLVILAIVGILGAIVFGAAGGGCTTSEGFRDGFVQKVSHKGICWTTNEGEMAQECVRGSGAGVSNVWAFSCPDNDVFKQIEALNAKDFVRLHYKEKMWQWWWVGDTHYRIVKVEILQKADLKPPPAEAK